MDGVIMIRQETEEDFKQVQEVVRLAFQGVEESDRTEHLLVERLRRSDAYIPNCLWWRTRTVRLQVMSYCRK